MMAVERWVRDLLSQIRWSCFGLELYTVEVKLCVLGKGIDKNILGPAGWLRVHLRIGRDHWFDS